MTCLWAIMASMMVWSVLSVSRPLKVLIPQSTKRQFSGTYPAPGLTWSMLGENTFRFWPKTNGNPENSQYPVQRFRPHVSLSEKGKFLRLARIFAADISNRHGVIRRERD